MRRLAVLSLHTSPLSQPGQGDAGGMNVYVRELVASLAQSGVDATVYVRRAHAETEDEVEVEPGFRVVHIDAGPAALAKEDLPSVIDDYRRGVEAHILAGAGVDALHANYWLSGVAGHQLKHRLDLPLVSTFHTLARAKAETGDREPSRRIEAEIEVVGCSDAILANSPAEADQLVRLYGAPADRIEIVPPGVDHAFFSPGDQDGARRALGLGPGPLLLFAGRIQPLKGLDVAIEALAWLPADVGLVAVGGASGISGRAEVARMHELVERRGLTDRVTFVEAQPHHLLSTYYRACDAVVMPSRSESFGLVALEAAACGIPVVAADVGGLRTLVADGHTGYLIDERDPLSYATALSKILDDSAHAAELGAAAVDMARRYTWSTTAARLRRLYTDLSERVPVGCRAA